MVNTGTATSAEDFKNLIGFESIRKTLLQECFADRLEKPLAFWSLPSDRRLPMAFLGRSIKEILSTPFEELSATPGVGQKKIRSLVKLLARAAKDQPPMVPFGFNDVEAETTESVSKDHFRSNGSSFDPANVSEALWVQWKNTVLHFGVELEKLGRLAPKLIAMPTVIWNTRLQDYLEYQVDEIRNLKKHGEKRVRVILEVFSIMHDMLSGAAPQDGLFIRILPKFVGPIESWISEVLEREGIPETSDVQRSLTLPLVQQMVLDAGETVAGLAEVRLGIHEKAQSVRFQAQEMGVTRARVYQLLEICSNVMDVRWPEGKSQLLYLQKELHARATKNADLNLFDKTVELFYPSKQDRQEGNGKLANLNLD